VLRQEAEIAEHRKRFEENPRDVEHAKVYWNALGRIQGCDIRSGRAVAEAFGLAAVSSIDGAIAFARAYQELFDLSGEAPRAEFVSPEVRNSLAAARRGATPDDINIIDWVLYCVGQK
jgi:hypothetical protein